MKYKAKYDESRALVIGINEYEKASPLSYAVNDAEAIAQVVKERYGFTEENTRLLKNKEATKHNIEKAFHAYAQNGTSPDDKLIVFFAGHGHTVTGNRGEVGFLVPVDGDPEDTSTLIRWDYLTRATDLIKAKHILFIMDACYGGLAITRALPAGSSRFLKSMCQKLVRQVLTAGKADETVADAGGPIEGHSVFTGHLIQALEGNAQTEKGIITANGVMNYVYNKVANDQYSRQTPHYGFIEGDGDFIFQADILKELAKDEKEDDDIIISVPATYVGGDSKSEKDVVEITKEYVADDRYTIKLHDLVVQEIRKVIDLTSPEYFPLSLSHKISGEVISDRLSKYEEALRPLCEIIAVLGYWGEEKHRALLDKLIARIAEQNQAQSGLTVFLDLRWYAICLLLYIGGIASIAANKYANLSTILLANGPDPDYRRKVKPVICAMTGSISDLHDAFKTLPGHEKHYVPRSEYMFKNLQPLLEDIVFLGNSYEQIFDSYELFQMFVNADLADRDRGLIGRFGWKHNEGMDSVVTDFVDDAKKQGDKWPPLQAGLFKGDIDRFVKVSEGLVQSLNKLSWF